MHQWSLIPIIAIHLVKTNPSSKLLLLTCQYIFGSKLWIIYKQQLMTKVLASNITNQQTLTSLFGTICHCWSSFNQDRSMIQAISTPKISTYSWSKQLLWFNQMRSLIQAFLFDLIRYDPWSKLLKITWSKWIQGAISHLGKTFIRSRI